MFQTDLRSMRAAMMAALATLASDRKKAGQAFWQQADFKKLRRRGWKARRRAGLT
jgi:hypothetical protein